MDSAINLELQGPMFTWQSGIQVYSSPPLYVTVSWGVGSHHGSRLRFGFGSCAFSTSAGDFVQISANGPGNGEAK